MPRFGTYISIDQLGYPRASIRDVVRLASSLNRDAALVILGIYNLSISLASTKSWDGADAPERLNVQTALLRNSISEARLRQLRAVFTNADLVTTPLYHRAQLLTMIKLAAKFGSTVGGNRLERREDFDVLAELGLLVNSLFPRDGQVTDIGDALAPSLAASVEIENSAPVAESMMRATAMLGGHLDTARIHSAFARQLERLFLLSAGLNFEELIDLTFAVWSYYYSLTTAELVQNQSLAHFNPHNPANVIAGRHLIKALDAYAVAFGEVPGLPFGPADGSSFLYNHAVIRAKPFWKLGDDNYLCVDPAFLQEKLSSGLYWTLIKSLDHDGGVQFARLWGRLFEYYLWATLEATYPRERLWQSLKYEDTGDEAFDAVIDCGDRLIVFQAKSTFVPVEAKYSSDPLTFFDGIQTLFGDGPHGALRQIRENVLGCFAFDGARPVAALRGRSFREILPVVVYQEPVLRFGLATRHFAKLLEQQLRGVLFQLDMHVRPVVFMHVNDLHMVAQYVRDGDVTLIEALQAKLARDPDHIHSFDTFWREQFRPGLGLAPRGDRMVAAAWKMYSDDALARFQSGVYS